MRVEILEARLSDTDPDTGRHHALEAGDIITVPNACGARWCAYGWARDVSGVVPTGTRVPGARAPLDVHDGQLSGG